MGQRANIGMPRTKGTNKWRHQSSATTTNKNVAYTCIHSKTMSKEQNAIIIHSFHEFKLIESENNLRSKSLRFKNIDTKRQSKKKLQRKK